MLTKIEWTANAKGKKGFTINPWRGCEKEHAGCAHCYAEVRGIRFDGDPWGPVWQGGRRVMASPELMKGPLTWARAAARAGERRSVFLASLSDFLERIAPPEKWPDSWEKKLVDERWAHVVQTAAAVEARRAEMFVAMEATVDRCGAKCGALRPGSDLAWGLSGGAGPKIPICGRCGALRGGLDYLVLTKRPQNAEMIPVALRSRIGLGTSISDQPTAEKYLPMLLANRGFRFLFCSYEPAIGAVDFTRIGEFSGEPLSALEEQVGHVERARLDWVISGGESGTSARPNHVDWHLAVGSQCAAVDVAYYCKQLGRLPQGVHASPGMWMLRNKKGSDPSEWPKQLRKMRKLPEALIHGT